MDIIYISKEHQIIIEPFLELVESSLQELLKDEPERYKEITNVCTTILEYHNGYSVNKVGGYTDFLSIIPVNYLVMLKGFMAGYENETNRLSVRAYLHLLTEYSFRVVGDLEKLVTHYE